MRRITSPRNNCTWDFDQLFSFIKTVLDEKILNLYSAVWGRILQTKYKPSHQTVRSKQKKK